MIFYYILYICNLIHQINIRHNLIRSSSANRFVSLSCHKIYYKSQRRLFLMTYRFITNTPTLLLWGKGMLYSFDGQMTHFKRAVQRTDALIIQPFPISQSVHMYLFLMYSRYMSTSSWHRVLTQPRPVWTWHSNTSRLWTSTSGAETS